MNQKWERRKFPIAERVKCMGQVTDDSEAHLSQSERVPRVTSPQSHVVSTVHVVVSLSVK